jgi:hypothetical protein
MRFSPELRVVTATIPIRRVPLALIEVTVTGCLATPSRRTSGWALYQSFGQQLTLAVHRVGWEPAEDANS